MKTITLSLLATLVVAGATLTAQTLPSLSNANYFTQDKSRYAFSHPVSKMNEKEEDMFVLGKSFFRIPWVEAPSATTARDGLGPLFNANTCIHCHPNNSAGVAVDKDGVMNRSYLLRLSHKETNDTTLSQTVGFVPDSTYGAQLSRNGNQKVPAEAKVTVVYQEINGTYADGTLYSLRKPHYLISQMAYGAFDPQTIVVARIGLALIGLGHLEKIPPQEILAHEDINDTNKDGISGKANYVLNPQTNQIELGRFTWKASATTVKHQTAAAAHNDMGLSNPFFPSHNCTPKQTACLKESQKSGKAFDLPQERLDAIAYYLSHLKVPVSREPQKHLEGKRVFDTLGCIACHTQSYTTREGIDISPYSDLLLHDMGEGLMDGRSEFLANGSEWRTPPLWGIGLYKTVSGEANYLHDGRARSIEEAILWHGGEAQSAKERFSKLEKKDREKLIEFLESL